MGLVTSILSTTAGRVGLAAGTAVVLALAWWLGSPLFLSKTVDEEFPLTVSATVLAPSGRRYRCRPTTDLPTRHAAVRL